MYSSQSRSAATLAIASPTVPAPTRRTRIRRSSSADLGHDVLDDRVVLDRVRAHVLAVARLPEAAVRHLRCDREVVIDPDRAVAQPACRVERPFDVARPDRRRESVRHAVRPADRLVVVAEALHGHDRAEYFLLDDLGILADVGDDRRIVEEAASTAVAVG